LVQPEVVGQSLQSLVSRWSAVGQPLVSRWSAVGQPLVSRWSVARQEC
jgi:hypothetical protein